MTSVSSIGPSFPNFFVSEENQINESNQHSVLNSQSKLVEAIREKLGVKKSFSITLSDLLFANLQKKDKSTPLQTEVAKKWTNNAINNIFIEPLRSFLELVVNAIDATNEAEESIGQFGMGFFSALCFLDLKETEGCLIEITTRYREDHLLRGYKLQISKNETDIELNYKPLKKIEGANTGTEILIIPNKNSFSTTTLQYLQNSLYHLQFTNSCISIETFIDPEKKSIESFNSSSLQKTVGVQLHPQFLKVVDQGTGISLQVSVENQFMIGSSTKNSIKKANFYDKPLNELVKVTNYKGKKEKEQSYFLILIGQVVVLEIALKKRLIIPENLSDGIDCCLFLPISVKTTLARNEILSDFKQIDDTEKHIQHIIDLSLKAITSCEEDPLAPYYFVILYNCFKEWEFQSTNQTGNRFTFYCKNKLHSLLLSNSHIIPISYEMAGKIYQMVGNQNKNYTLLPLPPHLVDHNFFTLTNFITNFFLKKLKLEQNDTKEIEQLAIDEKIIFGTKVFFVDDNVLSKTPEKNPIIESFGLLGCLFCPKSLLKKCEDLSLRDAKKFIAKTIMFSNGEIGGYNLKNTSENSFGKKLEKSLIFIKPINQACFYDTSNYPIFDKDFIELANEELHILNVDEKVIDEFWLSYINEHASSLDVTHFPKIAPIKMAIEIFEKLLHEFFSLNIPFNTLNIAIKSFFSKKDIPQFYYNLEGKLFVIDYELIEKELIFALDHKTQYKDLTFSSIFTKLYPNEEQFFSKITKVFSHKSFINALFLESFVYYGLIPLANFHQCYAHFVKKQGDAIHLPLPDKEITTNSNKDSFVIVDSQKLYPFFNPTLKQIQALFSCLTIYRSSLAIDPCQKKRIKENKIIFNSHFVNEEQLPIILCELSETFFIQKIQQDFVLAKNSEKLLEQVLSFTNVYYVLANNKQFNQTQQKQIRILKNTYFNLLHKTLTLSLTRENVKYACKTIFDYPKFSERAIFSYSNLLLSLSQNKDAFEKFNYFTILSWLKDLHLEEDLSYDKKIIINNNISIPLLGNHTFLTQFIKLEEQKISIKLITIILNLARNLSELILLANFLLFEKSLHAIESDMQIEKFTHFIEQTLPKNIFLEDIESWYNNFIYKEEISFDKKAKNINNFCLIKKLQEIYNQENEKANIRAVNLIEPILEEKLPPTYFSLSQLITAFFLDNQLEKNLKEGHLQLSLASISKTEAFPFLKQNILQTIHYSTGRDPWMAMSIETTQNAVDAITHLHNNRALFKKNKLPYQNKIFYEVCLYKERHITYSIEDHSGFKNLFSLLVEFGIPNFSQKNSPYSIGKMGNGVFTIYQNAQKVIVQTRLLEDSSKVYLLTIIPVRNEQNLIIDLQCKIADISEITLAKLPNFVGTRLHVVMNPSDNVNADLKQLKHVLKQTIASTNTKSALTPFIKLYFRENHQLINLNFDPLNPIKVLFQDSDSQLAIKTTPKEDMLSMVTTGGIPFIPLQKLVETFRLLPINFYDIVTFGITLEIPTELFTPVQNRTEITLSENHQKKIQTLLANVCYLMLFNKAFSLNQLDTCFYFYSSKGQSLEQIRLKKDSNFFNDFVKACDKSITFPIQHFMTYFFPNSLKVNNCDSFFSIVTSFSIEFVQKIKDHHSNRLFNFQKKVKSILKKIKTKTSEVKKTAAIEACLKEYQNYREDLEEFQKKLLQSLKNTLTKLWIKPNTVEDKVFLENYIQAIVSFFNNKSISLYTPFKTKESLLNFAPKLRSNIDLVQVHKEKTALNLLDKMINSSPLQARNVAIKPKIEIKTIFALKKDSLSSSSRILSLVKQSIESYYALFFKNLKLNTKPPMVDFCYEIHDSFLASFNKHKNLVLVNLSQVKYNQLVQIIHAITLDNPNKIMKKIQKYFWKNALSSGLFNHEAEHKRTEDGCESAHGHRKNIEGVSMPFEVSAIASFQRVAQNTMFLEWFEEVKKLATFHLGVKAQDILKQACIHYQSFRKEWLVDFLKAEFTKK